MSIGRKAAALTSDISDGGLGVELPGARFNADNEIDGYVLYGTRELSFRGRVSWCAPAGAETPAWSRLGIRFTWVSLGLRAALSIEQRRHGRSVAQS